eukprot:1481293-Prymnesium_polylepis.1
MTKKANTPVSGEQAAVQHTIRAYSSRIYNSRKRARRSVVQLAVRRHIDCVRASPVAVSPNPNVVHTAADVLQ